MIRFVCDKYTVESPYNYARIVKCDFDKWAAYLFSDGVFSGAYWIPGYNGCFEIKTVGKNGCDLQVGFRQFNLWTQSSICLIGMSHRSVSIGELSAFNVGIAGNKWFVKTHGETVFM